MAVVFDAAAHQIRWSSTVTSVDVPVTIGSGANRAVMVWIWLGSVTTGLIVFGAGATAWALVAGTDTGDLAVGRSLIWVGTSPASGAQTVSVSWNGLSRAAVGVISASGVHQTTPALNGTFHASVGLVATEDLTVTTGDGHMVADGVLEDNSAVVLTNGQNQAWVSNNEDSSGRFMSGDYKTFIGSGSFDMSYSSSAAANWIHSAMDFQPAALGPVFGIDSQAPQVSSRRILRVF